jgi:two-component system phosphate regulon sensor histidine kinase PhoR
MSLSLIGIILVQVFWFNSSFKNNDEQFKYHVTQVIGNVADKLEKLEVVKILKILKIKQNVL